MYSREINGQVFEFGVSGKLIRNVLVMYDRQTDSLWSQLIGEAVQGPMKGTQLEYLPSWQTNWEDWKARHPDTIALVKGYTGIRDPYLRYYASSQAGVIGETLEDGRLNTKQYVIGVSSGSDAVAYPYSVLNSEPVINDHVGSQPILVVFDSHTASGVVFDRTLNGQVLTFEVISDFQLVDDLTGSRWDGVTGEAISGSLEGAQLERLKSTSSFWFGWKDFYPSTVVYGVDS